MILFVHLFGGGLLGVGVYGDGCAMRIGARDHQYFPAAQALVTGENIGRKVGAGEITNVNFGVGVRPGDGNQDVIRIRHTAPRNEG